MAKLSLALCLQGLSCILNFWLMQLFRFELPIETVPSLLQSRSEYSSILHWPQDTCDLKSSFSSYIFKPTVGHSLDKELLLLGLDKEVYYSLGWKCAECRLPPKNI